MNVKKIILRCCWQHCWCCPWPPAAQQGNDKRHEQQVAMTAEPKNAQEAARHAQDPDGSGECHSDRKTQSLWEKVFLAADKGMTLQEDGKNYGDFLLDTIESAKDKFTADEHEAACARSRRRRSARLSAR